MKMNRDREIMCVTMADTTTWDPASLHRTTPAENVALQFGAFYLCLALLWDILYILFVLQKHLEMPIKT